MIHIGIKKATHLAAIVMELLQKRIAIPAESRLKFHNGARKIFFNESGTFHTVPQHSLSHFLIIEKMYRGILIEHVYEILKKHNKNTKFSFHIQTL